MPCCSAYGCSNRSDHQGIQDKSDPSQKRTYHKFPNDPERQKQWLVNVRRQDFTPTKYSALCSDHFEEWCFDRTGNIVRLRETAVPTIFSFSAKRKNVRKRTISGTGGRDFGEPVHKRLTKVTDRIAIKFKQSNNSDGHTNSNEESLAQRKPRPPYSIRIKKEELSDEENCNSQNSDENISNVHVKENGNPVICDDGAQENANSTNSESTNLENETSNSSKANIKTEKDLDKAVDSQHKSKRTGKDKIIYLPDNRTYFEFATPKKKVILQLKPPKSEPSELKTENLEELVASLRSRQLITSNLQALLEAFGEIPQELERIATNNQKTLKEQTEKVKKFASVLFTFSPKAYDLVGTVFRLPDKKTVQARLKVRDYRPGFTQEALNIIKKKIAETPADKICSIMLDSVDIRKQHSYDSCTGRWIGHVEFGGGQDPCDSDEIPLALEVLVFTAVGIGSNWKLPFAYFLNNGLAGEELQCLVIEAILVLEKCGLKVRALVCDGSGSTVKMGKLLGCKIHTRLSSEIITSFPHPSNPQQKIHLVFGFQHAFVMLKHLLEDKGTLRSSIYGIIKWKFYSQLFGYDGNSEADVTKNRKPDHNEFYHRQRIIRMCNPGFNYAVSQALELAEKKGFKEYAGSKAAANFTADLYRASDLLNSRNPVSRDKPPLRPLFLAEQLESMSIIGQRMFDLELLSGEPVTEGGRWMSVVLLAFSLKSVANLASELLTEKALTCITTYRLNLDHSGAILRCIQKRGGWDGTPSAAEFQAGYRKLLIEAQTVSSKSAVYRDDFEGEDLTVGQGVSSSLRSNLPIHKLEDDLTTHYLHAEYDDEVTVAAKYIIRYTSKHLSCTECVSLMLDDDTSVKDINSTDVIHIKPSNFMREILKISEKLLKIKLLESDQITDEHLILHIFCKYITSRARLQSLDDEHAMQEPHHVISLIKVVIRSFIKFRLQTLRHSSRLKERLLEHS